MTPVEAESGSAGAGASDAPGATNTPPGSDRSVFDKRTMLVGMAALVFAVDRFGKAHVASSLAPGEQAPLLGDLLRLANLRSSGAALGFFADWPQTAQLVLFGLLSVVCVGVAISFYRGLAPREHAAGAALGAILAGVSSNAVDRFVSGASIDFLALGRVAASGLSGDASVSESPLVQAGAWAVFNFADVAIVLGVVTLIVELLATELATRAQESARR